MDSHQKECTHTLGDCHVENGKKRSEQGSKHTHSHTLARPKKKKAAAFQCALLILRFVFLLTPQSFVRLSSIALPACFLVCFVCVCE